MENLHGYWVFFFPGDSGKVGEGKRMKEIAYNNLPIEEVVRNGLKEQLNRQEIDKKNHVPHYRVWNDRDICMKGVLIQPLTETWEDRKYLESLKEANSIFEKEMVSDVTAREPKQGLFNSKAQEFYESKFWEKDKSIDELNFARKFYKDIIMKSFGDIDNYYDKIGQIILNRPQYFMFDMKICLECEQSRKEAKEVHLHFSRGEVREVGIKEECQWLKDDECYKIKSDKDYGPEDKSFARFADKRINDASIVFPYCFRNKVINDREVVFESVFREIQREMIYSNKLRRLFNIEKISLDSNVYQYLNVCERIFPMIPQQCIGDELDQYTCIIEHMTGINLSICYSYYYTKIMNHVKEKESQIKISHLLMCILYEFLEFPNVFTRVQIVREYMEPILFLNENIQEMLVIVGEKIEKLKGEYIKKWDEQFSLLNMEESKKMFNNKVQSVTRESIFENNKERVYKFQFADYKTAEIDENYFSCVCRNSIKRLIQNYIKNN